MHIALARLATLLGGGCRSPSLDVLRRRLTDPTSHRSTMPISCSDSPRSTIPAMSSPKPPPAWNGPTSWPWSSRDGPGRAYDPAEPLRLVESVIAAFPRAVFDRLAGSGLDTQRPVFIVGLPRSGTTLIEQILASHPRVHGAGEVPLARRSIEEIPGLLGRADEPMSCMSDVTAEVIDELARRHDDRLREFDGGRCERIVTKMPENYFYLGLIAPMFPRAVLIHCRRDLRDVAVSCWLTNFNEIRWANHFDHIAGRFAGYRRLMDHWRSTLPATIHAVDYEETVADLEGVARRLLSVCGLEWHPACLEFHRTRRPIRTASLTQVRQPIYQRSVGRWKSYEHELADLFARIDSGGDA